MCPRRCRKGVSADVQVHHSILQAVWGACFGLAPLLPATPAKGAEDTATAAEGGARGGGSIYQLVATDGAITTTLPSGFGDKQWP